MRDCDSDRDRQSGGRDRQSDRGRQAHREIKTERGEGREGWMEKERGREVGRERISSEQNGETGRKRD